MFDDSMHGSRMRAPARPVYLREISRGVDTDTDANNRAESCAIVLLYKRMSGAAHDLATGHAQSILLKIPSCIFFSATPKDRQ